MKIILNNTNLNDIKNNINIIEGININIDLNNNLDMLNKIINYLDNKYYKRLYINLIYKEPNLDYETNLKETKLCSNFCNNLRSITNNKNLDIYIHSNSRSLMYIIKNNNISSKYGYYIKDDISYMDTSYYVFDYNMLDLDTIEQVLNMNKEVIININNKEELDDFNIIRNKINNKCMLLLNSNLINLLK